MPDWPFGKLRLFGYDLLVVDPPWPTAAVSLEYQSRKPRHPMSFSDIRRLPVGDLARRDCLLFCWATPQLLGQQIETVQRWGFEYVSKIEWYPNSVITRDPRLSYRVNTPNECILVSVMGDPVHDMLPGTITGGDRRYPRKPLPFYEMIERRCPQLTFRADVFTMKGNKRWDNWRPALAHEADDEPHDEQLELT
jgi:N6-adenosine-specific RNA methylase IME4